MDLDQARTQNLAYRRKYRGVIGVASKMPIKDSGVLSLVYTPGVAEPCREIAADPAASFEYTCRGNTIAIVSDGSSVLGLGNAGPEAATAAGLLIWASGQGRRLVDVDMGEHPPGWLKRLAAFIRDRV